MDIKPIFRILRPPVLAFIYLFLAVLLDLTFPSRRLIPEPFHLLGWVWIFLSLAVVLWSLHLFRGLGTTHIPHEEPTALVTRGPYQRSRNPMYLSVTLLLLGIAFLTGRFAYFLVPLAFFISMNLLFIPVEEAALQRIFGEAYQQYKSRVRRWF